MAPPTNERTSLRSALRTILKGEQKQRQDTHEALINIFWLAVEQFAKVGSTILVIPVVARYLGKDAFGLYSYGIALVLLFYHVSSLGLDTIVVRDLVKTPSDKHRILGTTFMLRVVGGASALVLSTLLVTLLKPNEPTTILVVFLIAIGQVVFSLSAIDFWFQSRRLPKYGVYARIIGYLSMSAVRISFVYFEMPIAWFAVVITLEHLVFGVFYLLFYRHKGERIGLWRVDFTYAGTLIRESFPLFMTGLLSLVYYRMDMIMLEFIHGKALVGFYGIAIQLSEIWCVVSVITLTAVYPVLVLLHKQNETLYNARLQQIMGALFWGSLVLSLVVRAGGRYLVAMLYGKEFSPAASLLSIYIFSIIIMNMATMFNQRYALNGTLKHSMYGALAGASVNLVLNMALIPRYGGEGAAIATLVSYTVPVLFVSMFLDRTVGRIYLTSVLEPLLSFYRLYKHRTSAP